MVLPPHTPPLPPSSRSGPGSGSNSHLLGRWRHLTTSSPASETPAAPTNPVAESPAAPAEGAGYDVSSEDANLKRLSGLSDAVRPYLVHILVGAIVVIASLALAVWYVRRRDNEEPPMLEPVHEPVRHGARGKAVSRHVVHILHIYILPPLRHILPKRHTPP